MRTTLELPDPLFARLKARASSERLTLKQLLRSYVEQGLSATPSGSGSKRSAYTLPRLEGPLAMESDTSATRHCLICSTREHHR